MADIKERSKQGLTNSRSGVTLRPAVHHNTSGALEDREKEGHTKTEQRPPAVQRSRPGTAVPTEEDKGSAKVQPLEQRELVIGLNEFLDEGRKARPRETDRGIYG